MTLLTNDSYFHLCTEILHLSTVAVNVKLAVDLYCVTGKSTWFFKTAEPNWAETGLPVLFAAVYNMTRSNLAVARTSVLGTTPFLQEDCSRRPKSMWLLSP